MFEMPAAPDALVPFAVRRVVGRQAVDCAVAHGLDQRLRVRARAQGRVDAVGIVIAEKMVGA